jgi:hypothetical protein
MVMSKRIWKLDLILTKKDEEEKSRMRVVVADEKRNRSSGPWALLS